MAVPLLPPGAPSRFDLVLLVAGLALAVGALVGAFSSVPLLVSTSVGSAIAGVALFEGLVRNPPVE